MDLIVGQEMAIEIKSSPLVTDKHLKGLRALKEEGADFLRRLWQGELL